MRLSSYTYCILIFATLIFNVFIFLLILYRIRTDNNIDNTSAVLEEWIGNVKHFYHKVDFRNTSEYIIDDASTPYEWTNMHYSNVVILRQEALDKAREVWADYLMVRL